MWLFLSFIEEDFFVLSIDENRMGLKDTMASPQGEGIVKGEMNYARKRTKFL